MDISTESDSVLRLSRRALIPSPASPGARSADFDVLPEAEASGDLLHRREGRLVGPGGTLVAGSVDHDIVELDAVRAFMIGRGLLSLLQPLRAHRGAREISVALALDDVVALGDDMVFQHCLHAGSSVTRGWDRRPSNDRVCPIPAERGILITAILAYSKDGRPDSDGEANGVQIDQSWAKVPAIRRAMAAQGHRGDERLPIQDREAAGRFHLARPQGHR